MPGTITDINQLDLNGTYTYADYLLWQFKERVELIRGKIFKMSPAPSTVHQRISSKLQGNLYKFLENHSCDLFSAPFDVRLPKKGHYTEDNKVYTVVQPDLCVICDASKLDKRGCVGAPDLVVEILSPGNSKKEQDEKFDLYEESGVREYWLVHPEDQTIYMYVLSTEGIYIGLKPATDTIRSVIFPELEIGLRQIFS